MTPPTSLLGTPMGRSANPSPLKSGGGGAAQTNPPPNAPSHVRISASRISRGTCIHPRIHAARRIHSSESRCRVRLAPVFENHHQFRHADGVIAGLVNRTWPRAGAPGVDDEKEIVDIDQPIGVHVAS